ncbi:MAG: hypothetical protein GTN38_04745 [Candidatus Aenigmarchaeota archaeon]|nr:hypothetical protein [Candidatus Aenigmarchaeota archaeon]NIP41055.1 hypothetical protein [Candidatus Aenigmarchaeota archaeon]NIQ17457.1 hypothetical protein [Candidatus Aenigmarchaeota archaeon]NIS73651.1 hypothetical protein [Candidatus Aenigmarchaeota archaeon]
MKWGLGIKTGIVAGAVYGFLAGIVATVVTILMREEIIKQIQAQFARIPQDIPITAEQVYPITVAMSIPGSIIGGLIVGAVLGIVFLVLYGELLGKDSKRKGIFFAVLLIVGTGLAELAFPGSGLSLIMIQTRYILLTPVNILFFLVFGYLLGKFYDRFKK